MVVSPSERRVLRAFLRAVALAEPLQRELASRHGISLASLYAVRVLARIGESPISQYGDALGVPRSTITNLVDRLERKGLAERLASPTDRRVTLVRLTPAGRRAVEETNLLRDSDVANRLLTLDSSAQATLADLLERVVAGPSEPPSVDPERRFSKTDRRVTLVALTGAGHEAVEDTQPIRSSRVAAYLLALEPETQELLAELLERVVEGSSEPRSASDAETTR